MKIILYNQFYMHWIFYRTL